jgi:CBS domain-containing protein
MKLVKDIMTRNLFTVDVKDSIADVNNLIVKKHIRHIPVVKNGKLVGIISKTDINRMSFSGLFENTGEDEDAVFEMLSIEQVMRQNPRVVNAENTIKEVAEILSSEDFHALPVVNNDGSLAGIVTTTDLINYLLTAMNHQNQAI